MEPLIILQPTERQQGNGLTPFGAELSFHHLDKDGQHLGFPHLSPSFFPYVPDIFRIFHIFSYYFLHFPKFSSTFFLHKLSSARSGPDHQALIDGIEDKSPDAKIWTQARHRMETGVGVWSELLRSVLSRTLLVLVLLNHHLVFDCTVAVIIGFLLHLTVV